MIMMQNNRVVLKPDMIKALRNARSPTIDNKDELDLQLKNIAGKRYVLLRFDIFGLDYTELFVDREDGFLRAVSFFDQVEFDSGLFKIGKDFVASIYPILLDGMVNLLSGGIKTFFFCAQHDGLVFDNNCFIYEPVKDTNINIKTITPMNYFLFIPAKSSMERLSIDWGQFQNDFTGLEQFYKEHDMGGIRVVSGEEMFKFLDKLVKKGK